MDFSLACVLVSVFQVIFYFEIWNFRDFHS
jgi:hypothetical protein